MWDACMDNASPGVGLVSQTGSTSVINQEYALAGENIFGMVQGDLVPTGSGETSRTLKIDKDHQFVSGISMLVPSPDRLVGVADLRLCDGDQWKREVQICFELFSTATATAKVAPEMERNSVQENNCSFGYVRFSLQPDVSHYFNNYMLLLNCGWFVPQEEPRSEDTRFDVAETCEPLGKWAKFSYIIAKASSIPHSVTNYPRINELIHIGCLNTWVCQLLRDIPCNVNKTSFVMCLQFPRSVQAESVTLHVQLAAANQAKMSSSMSQTSLSLSAPQTQRITTSNLSSPGVVSAIPTTTSPMLLSGAHRQ